MLFVTTHNTHAITKRHAKPLRKRSCPAHCRASCPAPFQALAGTSSHTSFPCLSRLASLLCFSTGYSPVRLCFFGRRRFFPNTEHKETQNSIQGVIPDIFISFSTPTAKILSVSGVRKSALYCHFACLRLQQKNLHAHLLTSSIVL